MGVFDAGQSNRKYNNAKPNYDVDDGVDIIFCDADCPYRDEAMNRCTFEACVLNQFPLSIPYHTSITTTCEICNEKFVITFEEIDDPYRKLAFRMCDKCKNKLISLIRGDSDD